MPASAVFGRWQYLRDALHRSGHHPARRLPARHLSVGCRTRCTEPAGASPPRQCRPLRAFSISARATIFIRPNGSIVNGCRKTARSYGTIRSFFHYVNVGPDVKEHEMITDVYLSLK